MTIVKPNANNNQANNEIAISPSRNLAKLGDFAFSYKKGAFDAIARTTTYNFASLERAQAPSLLQKTGGVEEEISLAVEFIMQKLSAFDSFRKTAAKRNPIESAIASRLFVCISRKALKRPKCPKMCNA